jgi:signal transduction histidine kinase
MRIQIVVGFVLLFLVIALLVLVVLRLRWKIKRILLSKKEQEEQRDSLEQLIKEKQQLIGLVSHDLKGPFNRIFSLVQLLSLSSLNFSEEQLEYLGKIHQVSADGLAMLRNLLDNQKLEEGGAANIKEKLNLTNLVSMLVKNYKILADKKKIQIHFERETEIIIKSDKISLQRIIENLLSNALKFSPSGANIFVFLEMGEDAVEFSIIDEGPGINSEDQKKLFLKYQTLAAKPTSGESSTGLGLYLVKKMVDKIEGRVWYETNDGIGSKFTVSLPKNIN